MNRIVISVLCFLPAIAIGAPFDGTWVVDPASYAWVHAHPDTYLLENGSFTCGEGACLPTFTVLADGKPHPVVGHPSYNNVAVTIVNASTVMVSARKGNTKDWDATYTVPQDGRTLTIATVIYEGGRSGTSKLTYSRSSAGPSGSHAVSGSWLAEPGSLALSPALSTVRYQESADGLQMTDPLGDEYEAKFDGKAYLTKGDPTHTLVSLERLGPREIRETDRSGAHIVVVTMNVGQDGKTMQVLVDDKRTGGSFKYLARRAP